jgi:hypothetical protein
MYDEAGEPQEAIRELRNSEPMMVKEDYRPSRQRILADYEINLRFLSGRGLVIRVGCKELAFEDANKGMEELTKYIENPYEEGKKWNKIFNE